MIETLRPGDTGYDESVLGFVGVGSPALVVRPRDADEVAAAIADAVDEGLAISVRSGGHSVAGHHANTGGVVIDLRHLDEVEVVDGERHIVRVGGGATWGKVVGALAPYGWSLTSGDTTSVGVGGLTLGGGIGWMVRKHGLTIDNLVAARVVTAEGRLLTASDEENPELFWALRGGGGNFGIVVDFDFAVHDTAKVHFGSITYALDANDPAELITRWRDVMRVAPDELSSTIMLIPRFPNAPAAAMVMVSYAGEPGAPTTEADAAIEPLLGLGTVGEAVITERPYSEILEDPMRVPGIRAHSRNVLVSTLDDDLIAAAVTVNEGPAPSAISIRSLGGAFGRVPADATAFAHRDAEAMVVTFVLMPDTAPDEQVAGALGPWNALAALGNGTYTNFQGSATGRDVAAAYPRETHARLAEVKRTYDPANVFALNHNVEPPSVADAEGPAA